MRASEAEVVEAIQNEIWQPALQGKWQVQRKFEHGKPSPTNQKVYQFKIVRAIFADDSDIIVVVTVIVYYGNEEPPK